MQFVKTASNSAKTAYLSFILSMGMVLICSCSSSVSSAGENTMKPKQSIHEARPVQIIVKFKDSVSDPSRDEFVQDLSHTVKANIYYLRPMSGDAHVYRVETGGDKQKMKDILDRLSKRPDILYAEPDGIMTHQ
jgi:hypothetical protein